MWVWHNGRSNLLGPVLAQWSVHMERPHRCGSRCWHNGRITSREYLATSRTWVLMHWSRVHMERGSRHGLDAAEWA
jgi:hypothetical protein